MTDSSAKAASARPSTAERERLSGPLLALYARVSAWRRQATSLYSVCHTQMLEWPALSLEWLPDRRDGRFTDFSLHHVAVGTQALPGSLNYAAVVEAAVPVDMDELADYLRGEDGVHMTSGAAYIDVKGHTRVSQLLPVDGIVQKMRSMPQSTDVMAISTSASPIINVHRLDDRPKFSAEPADSVANVKLKGLKTSGFALDWSATTAGLVAGGADDGGFVLWDIAGAIEDLYDEDTARAAGGTVRFEAAIPPLTRMEGHRDVIHDLGFHRTHANVVATCCQDGDVGIWDTRVITSTTSMLRQAHPGGAFGVSFHPSAVYNLATCGADGAVSLWDIRKTEAPTHELMFHTAGVAGVQWAPFSDSALLSYGLDGNVCLWDLARSGMDAAGEGDRHAPAELAFLHSGHLSRVTDARWCPSLDDEWLVASVDATNMLQIFRPTRLVLEEHIAPEAFDADGDD
jgi:histone-binding protein RBBP4